MILSRLTFSLASLVFFISLGLIFAPTSVMAHDGTIGNLNHDHPTATLPAIDVDGDGDMTGLGEAQIEGHNAHPKLVSIKLKTGDTVKDNEVVIVANDVTTTDVEENQFTIIVDFNMDVSQAANAVPDASVVPLADSEISSAAVGMPANTIIASPFTIGTPTRVTNDLSQFEVVITVLDAALPSTTNTSVKARFRVDLNAVYSGPEVPTNALAAVNGIGNAESDIFEFTLVPSKANFTPTKQPVADGMITSIPAESYVVLVHDEGSAGLPPNLPAGATVMKWAGMPNLKDLFVKTGGTIALTGSDSATFDHDNKADTAARKYADRDVIISEVMAGINLAARGTTGEFTHQWIEVYNKLKVPATNITISAHEGRTRPTLTGKKLLDQLSNQVGQGWAFTGLGQDGSDDGDPATADIDFKSFYRDKTGDPGENEKSWATATELYFAGHLGTPGEGEPVAPKTFAKSTVNQTVIFNEISNSDTPGHEWIELMIKSGDPDFNNWQVSMVTAKEKDDELFTLPKLDKARFDKILLVTASDPANDPDHPLAAGYDVTKSNDDNANQGRDSSIKYVTVDWKMELPDGGKFVLILRNVNDKRKTHEKVEDIAGYTDANLSKSDADTHTDLWPLVNHGKPNITRNNLDKGVHRRQHGILGTTAVENKDEDGKAAFINIGWTGIGYKRNAQNITANGGTPGYPHSASLSDEKVAADTIIISEIMYSQGAANRIAQWIELHNPSDTQGVNLNNWELRIVNHSKDAEDKDFKGNVTEQKFKLSGIDIPPNQTALIVSHAGRNTTMLPKQRLMNLRSTKTLLNPNGFYISLWAHTHKDTAIAGDTAGNLVTFDSKKRSDHQSYTPPVWELPSGVDENDDRVSISRRTSTKQLTKLFGETTELDGTNEDHWVLTNEHSLYYRMVSGTYYGHANDIATPGQTVGSVLPVSLSKFRPERLKATGEVVIRWVTESELNNAGFNILRSEKRDGEFTKLNEQLILGQGTTSERTAYEWKDTTAKPNVVYYYQIQDVSLDGDVQTLRQSRLKGNVTPAGKLTTTWGELKSQD